MPHCGFSVLIIYLCYTVILGILENCTHTHTQENLVTLKSLANMRSNLFSNVILKIHIIRASEFPGMNLSIQFVNLVLKCKQ